MEVKPVACRISVPKNDEANDHSPCEHSYRPSPGVVHVASLLQSLDAAHMSRW